MIPAIPKLIGFEYELGNHFIEGSAEIDSEAAGRALCAAFEELYSANRGEREPGSQLGEFSPNGFRFYLDHLHAEICSPMAQSAHDLVLLFREVRKVVLKCKALAEKKSGRLRVSFNNTNRCGKRWGFHLSCLVQRKTFDSWREDGWAPLKKQFIPHLVSSLPVFGSGKVGSENAAPHCHFQLSQRADFIDKVIGLETVHSLSLHNERDEALACYNKYARLHLVSFDSNQFEFANWLKFGTVQLLLALLEEGWALPDLTLAEPVSSLSSISRDLSFRELVSLADGSKRTGALEIQRLLANAATDAVARGGAMVVPHAGAICRYWIQTLEHLASCDEILLRRLDWCAKRSLVEKTRDPILSTALDLRFGEVGNSKIQASLLNGAMEPLESFLPQARAFSGISPISREKARCLILERFPEVVSDVDWHRVWLRNNATGKEWLLRLEDPFDAEVVLSAISDSSRPNDFLECLKRREALEEVPKFDLRGLWDEEVGEKENSRNA